MAKIQKKYSFSKGQITRNNDGTYVITEYGKDTYTEYDLTSVLDSFIGLDGITLSIGVDDDVPTINDTDTDEDDIK